MLFEIFSTASLAGISLSTIFLKNKSTNDHEKISKIADRAGLFVKEGGLKKSIRIYRKSKKDNYAEYVYKIPLGLSFKDFEDKKQLFIDGLNNKSRPDFNLKNLKNIDWKGDVIKQIIRVLTHRTILDKQIEIEYDGMLKFKVYDRGLENLYLYTDEMLEELKGWEVPIGYTYYEFVTHDFEKLQMLVVAGMTRYGKTVFLKNTITTLLTKQQNNVLFTLIDLKGGLAFNRFRNCKQVRTVAKNEQETIFALEEIHDEMLNKQQEFLQKGYEDITEAGDKNRHFIIVDEGAEISSFESKTSREKCAHLIGEIARIGAGLGYRLIFATQYPTADVFPRQVKANTSAALCFKLKNGTQSTVVLGKTGAEELPAKLYGRAIYQSDQEVIVQTPFIKNPYINQKIKIHIRSKEGLDAPIESQKLRETGGNSIKFEAVGLPYKKTDSKAAQSKRRWERL